MNREGGKFKNSSEIKLSVTEFIEKVKERGSLLFRVSELSNLYIPRTRSFQYNSLSEIIFYGETFTANLKLENRGTIKKKKTGKYPFRSFNSVMFAPNITFILSVG